MKPTKPKSKQRRATVYAALGVSPGATDTAIRAAYLALANQYHPDKLASPLVSAVKMSEINMAYAVLKDPAKRRLYDQGLSLYSDQCKGCKGTGLRVKSTGFSTKFSKPCPDCDGTGWEER